MWASIRHRTVVKRRTKSTVITTSGFLLLVVRPGATSSFLLLVAMPSVTTSGSLLQGFVFFLPYTWICLETQLTTAQKSAQISEAFKPKVIPWHVDLYRGQMKKVSGENTW